MPEPKNFFFKFLSENFSVLSMLLKTVILFCLFLSNISCCEELQLMNATVVCCEGNTTYVVDGRAVSFLPYREEQCGEVHVSSSSKAKRGCSRAARNFCDFSDFYLTCSQNVVRGLRLRLDLDASKGYKHRQSCDAVLVLRDFSIFTIL